MLSLDAVGAELRAKVAFMGCPGKIRIPAKSVDGVPRIRAIT
jgi:hypothetical protein